MNPSPSPFVLINKVLLTHNPVVYSQCLLSETLIDQGNGGGILGTSALLVGLFVHGTSDVLV